MDGHRELMDRLLEIMGEEGCGVSCEDDADIFHDDEGWKLMLCGFMEPWELGTTIDEAKATLTELGSMRFGLS
jgi:hypothetical protein